MRRRFRTPRERRPNAEPAGTFHAPSGSAIRSGSDNGPAFIRGGTRSGLFLHFSRAYFTFTGMTKPLALVAYENLMPGSRLLNRLQDLGYRVQVLSDAAKLVAQAEALKPLLVIVDLVSKTTDVCAAIAEMKQNPHTTHIPILAYADSKEAKLQKSARESGASMVASDAAIFDQFPQMLDQLLAVE